MTTDQPLAGAGRVLVRLIIAFLVSFCLPTLSARAGNPTVKVGVYENAPKIFTPESGKPAGIFIDIVEYIAAQEGWDLQYVTGNWAEGLDRLTAGDIDLMPDVAHTASREKIYDFHRVPVISSWFEVYAAKGSKIRTILDLNDKRVLVLDRSIQQEAFGQLSKGFGLQCTLITTPDYKTMFHMVAEGKADAAITNRFYGLMHAKKSGLENTAILFEPSDLFFAATKDDPKRLLATVDKHLEVLKHHPQSAYYASMKRWTSEEVALQWPLWLQVAGLGGTGLLVLSLAVSALLRHQVKVRTDELLRENEQRQAAQQRLTDIIEFLPDATFVIDQEKRLIAWNQACEALTGVKKEKMLGQNDYAYAEPFFGERRPILVDLLDQPAAQVEAGYLYVQRKDSKVYGESFVPCPRGGKGAHLWGVASPLFDRDGRRCGAIETIRDITDQRLVEDALRTSEREYRELVMLANSIIMRWSPEGLIIFLNEFGQRFFGYTATEIFGRHVVGTVVPENESKGRNLRPLMQEICLNPQKFERNINENIRRSGERVWIDWTNKAVFDDQGQIKEILSIGSDISKRLQAEEQVRRLNDELRHHAETLEQRVAERTAELAAMNDEQRTIFESASTGIVLLRERTIVRCNRKLEEISGYAPGELTGKSTRIWYPNEQAFLEGGEKVYAQMAKGDTFRQEQQIIRKDGSRFWARMSLRAIDKNAPIHGAVGIIEDITHEHEAAENLRRAMAAAQAADRIKSAFLATMSHELRTPLNSIIGFTGIMLQGLTGPLNAEQHKQMSMVQNSSRHLLSLINDVLDISKIEAGQLALACAPFDLGASIVKMVNLVTPLAEKKGIALRMELGGSSITITNDQRRLEQVILNLLNNSIKFTDKGDVGIACRRENDLIVLAVSDTGIGMQEAELPHLFQPFRQIDTGLARKREGTGLGLSICKKIVDLMEGSIEVQSSWGEGSTFTVRLPIQPGAKA